MLSYVYVAINNENSSLMLPTCHGMRASGINSDILSLIVDLLTTYVDIFEEPSHLPHTRAGFNHKITLKEEVEPLNLRPYHFSLVHKTVIDKLG